MGIVSSVKCHDEALTWRPWHDRHMVNLIHDIAADLGRQHTDRPRLLFDVGGFDSQAWRTALRRAGVPVLELNEVPEHLASSWLDGAWAFSGEFLMPVVIFGGQTWAGGLETLALGDKALPKGSRLVADEHWLRSRQVALTRAVETSTLNQEFRRGQERRGWIRIGWQPAATLETGNGLVLAWSSPLPLRRIRDFAARCPEITLSAPDAEVLADEVAGQGISVTGWRFAVK